MTAATDSTIKKVVLAYSGGLDTSIILKWLQTTYGCEVVTFTADLGQGEELGPAREKALRAGIKPENIFIEDLREEFVKDFVFPMFRANAQYEGLYLLGTSIATGSPRSKSIEMIVGLSGASSGEMVRWWTYSGASIAGSSSTFPSDEECSRLASTEKGASCLLYTSPSPRD